MAESNNGVLLVALAVGGYLLWKHEEGECASCVASAPLGIAPPPGTGTASGPQTGVAKSICEALAKAGATAGAQAAGAPPQAGGAVSPPAVTGPLCDVLWKGAKEVGHVGAVVGKFVGHEVVVGARDVGKGAKAVVHVTATAVKDVGKVAGKVGGALASGAKGAEHAVSSGIHKVLGWL